MTIPLFMGLSAEGATTTVVKGLAVAGAFLVGFGLTGLLAAGLDRWLFHRKSPGGMKRAARVLGGVLAAVVAAMILFGSGGAGLFGGGGGAGTNTADGTAASHSTPANSQERPTAKPPNSSPAEPTNSSEFVAVRVLILSGDDVRDNRFYKLDNDPAPKTFAELKTILLSRKAAEKKKLALTIHFPERNALARDHMAVVQLERWAKENDIFIG